MRAMRAHGLGEALTLDEIEPPQPGPGEVRLRVLACGVNFADTLMVAGKYQEKPPVPFSPGIEVCGVVDAVGDEADALAPGTRVSAICGWGGFAEGVCAPAAACVPVPEAMPDAVAATLQIAYGTSHLALGHRARMRPGERLLVLGAGGGVGLTAVEIGKLMGAEVIAVARGADKQDLARERGADHVLDADPAAIRDAVRALGGADVIYDPVGGDFWKEAMRAANFEARLLPIGFASGEVPQIPANHLLVKNIDVIGLYWGAYLRHAPAVLGDSLRQLLAWWESGAIRPHVSNTLPLERAEDALALLRDRAAAGKVALVMGDRAVG
jgi:NADPH2:quinone reductase